MIHCKKHIIAACLGLMLPLACWSEAPVVDDSDNFAMMDEQQAYDAPAANPKYDEPMIENAEMDRSQSSYESQDSGQALVKEDATNEPKSQLSNNAQLIDKVQKLQQEVQELRGQLEVQTHDLKLLQQQQLSFYKDLDSRIAQGGGVVKAAQTKAPTDLSLGLKTPAAPAVNAPPTTTTVNTKTVAAAPVGAVSRINPADEQISHLAAYELVKNKRYDDAVIAMQTFVQKYPKGGYSANAEYWLGELYLVKREFPKAIEHFDIVLKQYPSSSKSAASLLKSGYAFVASGNKDEARNRFQQVVKNYPGTPTAQLATNKLESINAL